MNLTVRKLTPGDGEALIAYFDGPGFSDNPSWRTCYCTFFHKPVGYGLETGKRMTNKTYCRQLVSRGILRGYLALDEGGRIRGWVNVNEISRLNALLPSQAPEGTRAVVCFVVEPGSRRQGVASRMMETILQDARTEGWPGIEAYPARNARSDAGHFHGPESLYRKFGFTEMPGRSRYTLSLEFPPGSAS